MLLQELEAKNLIHPPKWLSSNTQYLTIMGSLAYGVSSDSSDMDIYGWCIPKKELVFPHISGEIPGFGKQIQRFEQWQQHHIKDQSALSGKGQEYDFSVYSIVKYFQLCMDNNPNMIDSLFVPQTAILHISQIGNMVRENRKMFLHKGSWHKFKGYAYSQLHKMKSKNPEGKRKELIDLHGYDVKFAYHVIRLISECEQILVEGDLDLQEKGRREHMKAIRNGEVSQEDIERWFQDKEKQLEKLYHESKLQYKPDESKIKNLLLDCLEQHYGSLSNIIEREDKYKNVVKEIQKLLDRI